MKLTSTTFEDGGTMPVSTIYDGMGQSGGNASPQLTISDVPAGTKSLAIVVHDPDAPTSGGFYHWVLFDIPADTRDLPEGAGSHARHGATHGHTDYGEKKYGGPLPPPGPAHRYNFTVYALDTDKLGTNKDSTGAQVEFMLAEHTLAKATLTGRYGRS